MHTDAGTVLYLSFVTASICFAVTETRMFQRFREEIKRRNIFFGELVSCGYCLGHWVSGGLVVIYTPRLTRIWWPLDYLLTILIIAWLSAFQWVLMCCLMQKAGK